jgi:hypothetical protein
MKLDKRFATTLSASKINIGFPITNFGLAYVIVVGNFGLAFYSFTGFLPFVALEGIFHCCG